jgi:hypothetical protein
MENSLVQLQALLHVELLFKQAYRDWLTYGSILENETSRNMQCLCDETYNVCVIGTRLGNVISLLVFRMLPRDRREP